MLLHVVLLLTTWPTELRATQNSTSLVGTEKELSPEDSAGTRAGGFGPIVVPDHQTFGSTDYDHYSSASDAKSENVLENDPLYSSEARILLDLANLNANRRSFDTDSQYNEFELLKVTNDTAPVANYQEFYEDGYSAPESDLPDYKKSVGFNGYNPDPKKSRKPSTPVRTQPNQRENLEMKTDNRQRQFRPVVVVDPATYKVDLGFGGATVSPQLANVTPIPASSTPTSLQYRKTDDGTSRHYDRGQQSKGSSHEDYSDNERLRKLQKSRRRPLHDSSRKLPKEHREEDSYESGEGRKRPYHRYKPRYRSRKRPNWNDDDRYIDEDDSREDRRQNSNKHAWSQLDANLDHSQQSNYQVNQIEKPKLVPLVPFNIVPVGSFDHASALGNSQGFDVSNAMFHGLVPGTTLLSTAAPILSTAQSLLKSGAKSNFGIITPTSDVILGQNSIHNPVQTVFISQSKAQNGKTVAPIFAVTTTASPLLHGNAGKSLLASTPVQQYALNQLLLPQSTLNVLGLNQGNNLQSQKSLIQLITPKTRGYVHGTQIIPAFLQSGNSQAQSSYNPIVVPKSKDPHATISKAANEAFESSMQRLQAQIQKGQNTGSEENFQSTDVLGSTSNRNENIINLLNGMSEKAQLPNMETKNVEIFNPNLKQSQVGVTFANPLGLVGQYPTAVLTTPLPLIGSTNFATVRPVFSTLDEMGDYSQAEVKANHGQTLYNPLNFLPNLEMLRNQMHLNDKSNSHPDALPQSLNLVPSIPGGNFFKNSLGAQRELMAKPRIKSDLDRYAEEMLRESLRTVQDSHRWNKDKNVNPYSINLTDDSELAKLKNELLKMKGKFRGRDRDRDRDRDISEAHQTENKYVVERPGNPGDHRKPDYGKMEDMLMNDFKHPSSSEDIHVYHHHGPKLRTHKDSVQYKSRKNRHEIRDFLTPPKMKTFLPKSPFHEKKKRPAKHRDRPKSRRNKNPDISASEEYGVAFDNVRGRSYKSRSEYKKRAPLEFYPVLTTSFPETESNNFALERKTKDTYDVNHPRTHNLLGLLMKNPQLPVGSATSYVRNGDDQDKLYDLGNRRQYSPSHRPVEKKSEKNPAALNSAKHQPGRA